MTSALLAWAVFTPFIGAAIAPHLSRWLKSASGFVLALFFLPALSLLNFQGAARAGEVVSFQATWVSGLDLALRFQADGFAILFALIIAAVGFIVLIYASSYLGSKERHGRFFSYLLIFAGSMLGLVLADNLIALFAFWEMTSLSSFLLIGFWDRRRASQDGAVKALVVTSLGGLALLAGVILLTLSGGSVNLSEIDLAQLQTHPNFIAIALLLLFAAFTKSAQLPFHLWLPTAMEAPTPVSAYLHSATMVKAGVVLVAKFGPLFHDTSFASFILYVGLITMFWGSYLAIRQRDLKALLAYSTVSQLGLLMSLYGSGYPFEATTHLINHAAFKAALFLVVGIIDHETGSRTIGDISGLWRKLPITFCFAVIATWSMAGLPPVGGFISKELFYEAALHEGLLPIIIAVTGSMMTFAYCLRFIIPVFFGPFKCDKPNVHEAPVGLWLPILPLILAVLAFGLLPVQSAEWLVTMTTDYFQVKAYHLALWHGLNLALALSILTWFVGIAIHVSHQGFVSMQERLTPGWNANTVYYWFLSALESGAQAFTQRTQGGTFATHLRLLLLPLAVFGFIWGYRVWPTQISGIPLEFGLSTLLVMAGCVGVLNASQRLSALIFMGLAGFASTVLFLFLRAPDLALTQLLIETVTVILFLSVFRYMPLLQRYTRSRLEVGFDALLAVSIGGTVFTTLLAVQTPIGERIKDYFLEYSKTLGGGYNVVNVILVDFRGYDTMGEITVLAIAGLSIYALLKLRARTPARRLDTKQEQNDEES